MGTNIAQRMYEKRKSFLTQSSTSTRFWNEESTCGSVLFLGPIQIYLDKSGAILKACSIVSYTVYITLLNFSAKFLRTLISSGRSCARCLSVSLDDTDILVSQNKTRSLRMSILHRSIKRLLAPLSASFSWRFSCPDSNNV